LVQLSRRNCGRGYSGRGKVLTGLLPSNGANAERGIYSKPAFRNEAFGTRSGARSRKIIALLLRPDNKR